MFVLTSSTIDTFNAEGIAALYKIFKNDFLDKTLCIVKEGHAYSIEVNPHITCTCPFSHDEKTEKFWHLITTDINANRTNRVNPCISPKEKKDAMIVQDQKDYTG